MYENWRQERWQTPMSDAAHLFLESLHDHAAGLDLDFADYTNNIATARFRVTFQNPAAYRNIDESYRTKLWERHPLNVTGWTVLVTQSPWIREFGNEPVLDTTGLVHYMIATENDVVEVLSHEAPAIQKIT